MSTDSPRDRTPRAEQAATILLIIVTLSVGGFTLWDRLHAEPARSAPPEPPPPTEPIPLGNSAVRGRIDAPVAVIEFSDFECPYCARSAREVLPELEREYLSSGRAFLAWRHYPLPFHNQAQKIHEASECAAVQGKFWEFHDWIFSQGKIRDQAALRLGAEALQLDLSSFGTCLDGQARAKVQADVDLGDTLSITGTPTWFIGAVQPDGTVRVTHRLTGAKPFAAFKKAIDEATTMLESYRN